MTLSTEQKAIRATGIGASEVAPVLGISPWVSPFALYQIKRGEIDSAQPESAAMRFGNAVEPFILDEWQRNHPDLTLIRSPNTMRRGALLAHLDGMVPSVANVQAKTARTRTGWGDSGSPDVPPYYLVQVQAEMLVANLRVSYIPVWFAGSEYDEFVVEADRELQEMIEDEVTRFWRRVETGDPPPPQTQADMLRVYGRASRAAKVTADADTLKAAVELRLLRLDRADLDEREERLKAKIMGRLGDADTLIDESGAILATWKATKPIQRLDTKSLQAQRPDIYAEFLKAGEPSRRFLLKD